MHHLGAARWLLSQALVLACAGALLVELSRDLKDLEEVLAEALNARAGAGGAQEGRA